MLKAAATDSADLRNLPASTDDRIQNSNSTPLNSSGLEGSELPDLTLEEFHFDSNFRPYILGEQSSPNTRLSACHFDLFHSLSKSLEGSVQNEVLNEKEVSGYVEELEGNLSATINNELQLPQVCKEHHSLATVGSTIQQCVGNFDLASEGNAVSVSLAKSADRTGLLLLQREEQEEISPELESMTPTMRQNDIAAENSEENVNSSANLQAKIRITESLIDTTEHAKDPREQKENMCLHKLGAEMLKAVGTDELEDPKDAAKDDNIGSSIAAHCDDPLYVPDDLPKVIDRQILMEKIDPRISGQTQANSITMKQADQWQKLNFALTSIDSKGSSSLPDASKLLSGGSMSLEITHLNTSGYSENLAAKSLQTNNASTFKGFGYSGVSTHFDRTTPVALANIVSTSSRYMALPSSKDQEKMRESLLKKSSGDIQPTLTLTSKLGPSCPVLASAASKNAPAALKNIDPMASASKPSRHIMKTYYVDSKSKEADDEPLTLYNTNHKQDIDLMPPPVEITPRLITTSSNKNILHGNHPKSLKEGMDNSKNTPSITNSKTSLAGPQVITTLQHFEDVGNTAHGTVSKLVPIAATVSPLVTESFVKHDECNKVNSESDRSESFDCLLTKYLMDIRDVQDSLDVSSTEILDVEIAFAEIYNQALDMHGQMINSVEEIDAAMSYAEESIESTKEWV